MANSEYFLSNRHFWERHLYARTFRLMPWQRYIFDTRYSADARSDMDKACADLFYKWRYYRTRMKDRHVVPFTFKGRMAKYQKETYMREKYNSEGGRTNVNVYEQMCALGITHICPGFEKALVLTIAMFLLPSEQQHTPWYGFQGKSKAAAIDVTFVQPMIDGEVCTKEEHRRHAQPIVHLDELLAEWDAKSAGDDDEWE